MRSGAEFAERPWGRRPAHLRAFSFLTRTRRSLLGAPATYAARQRRRRNPMTDKESPNPDQLIAVRERVKSLRQKVEEALESPSDDLKEDPVH